MSTNADAEPRSVSTIPVESTLLTVLQDSEVKTVKAVLGEQAGISLHNFGNDPKTIWRMTSLASSGAALRKEDAVGKAIPVKWFYAHKVYLQQPGSGEYIDAIRVVLITEDKVCYQFVSDGIAADLASLVNISGLAPFSPPMPLKITSNKTRAGFSVYRLQPADG